MVDEKSAIRPTSYETNMDIGLALDTDQPLGFITIDAI